MAIYIQLKRSSTQKNLNSHHLNQAELSKLCTLQKHSTLHYIKHCHHVLWMSYSAVSTFCECQFCITVLSAHSVNISFALQCCQHVLWMSVLWEQNSAHPSTTKSTAIHSPTRLHSCTLKAWNPHLRRRNPQRERGSLHGHTNTFQRGFLFTKPNKQDQNPSALRPPWESSKVVLK